MLVLNRVSGLWKKEVLGKRDNVAGAGPGEWVCMGISIQGNRIATAFDGRPFFEEEDGDPLPGGYPGFCVPRHVKKFNFKEVSL